MDVSPWAIIGLMNDNKSYGQKSPYFLLLIWWSHQGTKSITCNTGHINIITLSKNLRRKCQGQVLFSFINRHFVNQRFQMKVTRNNCFRSKERGMTLHHAKIDQHKFSKIRCFFLHLWLHDFGLPKGELQYFRSNTILASFLTSDIVNLQFAYHFLKCWFFVRHFLKFFWYSLGRYNFQQLKKVYRV